jgi:hypothetical protein
MAGSVRVPYYMAPLRVIIFMFVSNLGHLYTKSLEWVTSKISRHCAICIRLIFDVTGGLWLFECKLFHLV